jgi:hypothetical protein
MLDCSSFSFLLCECELALTVVLICVFLMTNNADLIMCFLAIYRWSLKKEPLNSTPSLRACDFSYLLLGLSLSCEAAWQFFKVMGTVVV